VASMGGEKGEPPKKGFGKRNRGGKLTKRGQTKKLTISTPSVEGGLWYWKIMKKKRGGGKVYKKKSRKRGEGQSLRGETTPIVVPGQKKEKN